MMPVVIHTVRRIHRHVDSVTKTRKKDGQKKEMH